MSTESGFSLQRTIQGELGLGYLVPTKVRLAEVMKNFECFRLQRVCLFEFELRRLVLFCRGEKHAESEVQLHILLVGGR